MRVGFIIPAVAGEGDVLKSCLENLIAVTRELNDVDAYFGICWQASEQEAPPELPIVSNLTLLKATRRGVSAARNAMLDLLAGSVDAVMFVDVSVRPSARFLTSAVPLLSGAPLVAAPVAFSDTEVERLPLRRTSVSAAYVVFRGFVWGCMFRIDALRGARFIETIGPGTPSVHQAGEDARFLHAVITTLGVRHIPYLSGAPVRRLLRPDLSEKQIRYAHGQGYLVGEYLRSPTNGDRSYFVWRAFLFLGRSVLLMMRGKAGRSLGLSRIRAFMSGLRGTDTSLPPLATLEELS